MSQGPVPFLYCIVFDLYTDLKSCLYKQWTTAELQVARRPQTMMTDSDDGLCLELNQDCDTIEKSNNVPLNVYVTLLQ